MPRSSRHDLMMQQELEMLLYNDYYETLRYIQSAMHFTTYKNSPELLATIVLVSTFEMIDAAGKDWERHLKGAFWIQRCREINGESGGFEGAVWWAWLRQDVWAAFREHRRCFSFFRPTLPYSAMTMWDMASRAVYILAQAVNYSSDEEREIGEHDVDCRVQRAATLMDSLDEWRRETGVQFTPLSTRNSEISKSAFKPIWIHPSALGTSLQMYCMARILVLANQPAARGPTDHQTRTAAICKCIDTIGGIASTISDDASRYMSTQCLLAAGVYCTLPSKLDSIADLIREQSAQTGWPDNSDLTDQMRLCWAKHNP